MEKEKMETFRKFLLETKEPWNYLSPDAVPIKNISSVENTPKQICKQVCSNLKSIPNSTFINLPITVFSGSYAYTSGSNYLAVPTSYKILCGGVYVDPPDQYSLMLENYPSVSTNSWVGAVYNSNSANQQYTIYVYAIALYDPNNLYSLAYTTQFFDVICSDTTVTVSPGYTLTGGGFLSSSSDLSSAGFSACYPSSNTTWTIKNPSNATMSGRCISIGIQSTVSGQVFSNNIVMSQNSTPSANPSSVTNTVKQMCGGGGELFFQSGPPNFLSSIYPSGNFSFIGWGSNTNNGGTSTITVYAIELVLQQL